MNVEIYEMGQKARDKVTGFEGTLTGFCHYLYGCDQYLLTPKVDSNGNKVDGHWFDSGRIELTDEITVKPEEVQTDEPGGCRSDCPSCR